MGDNQNASKDFTGLDVIFVLVASLSIVFFILWLATAIRGEHPVFTPPAALTGLVSRLWVWLTTGALSVLLYFLKEAPGKKLLVWTLGTSAGVLLFVLTIAHILPNANRGRVIGPDDPIPLELIPD